MDGLMSAFLDAEPQLNRHQEVDGSIRVWPIKFILGVTRGLSRKSEPAHTRPATLSDSNRRLDHAIRA
jgi:hypothetical protein